MSTARSNLVEVNVGALTSTRKRPKIDYLAPASASNSFVGAKFLLECGARLGLESLTVASAACFFHAFNREVQNRNYDQYLIASACLYLAGKLEECDTVKLRDVVNVAHSTLHDTSEPLSMEARYHDMRDSICQAELLVLRVIKFQTKFQHPHKYLLSYLKALRSWLSEETWQRHPVARTSWCLLQDAYADPRVLNTDPTHMALAAIQLAMQTYGVTVPHAPDTDSTAWYKAFCPTATNDSLWQAAVVILEVFNNDVVLGESPVFKK